jgi:hypothetical protein
MRKLSRILGKQLNNSIRGSQLLNTAGVFSPSDIGYQYAIDTLSYIREQVIEQKFYEVPIADFMTVDIGQAAYASEIVQNLEFKSGGSFFDGDTSANGNMGAFAGANAFVAPVRMPTQFWLKGINWNIIEIKQSAQFKRWDAIEGKMKSLKKDWDLGIQEVAFLGHPTESTLTGLVNNSGLTPNTTFITTSISSMTTAEFKSFVAGLLKIYWTYCNKTTMPDTFAIPMTDYLGLGDFVSDLDVRMSKIEYLEKMFIKITRNPNFKIQGLAYCEGGVNSSRGIDKDRYILYRNDPETLRFNLPVDLTMFAPDTSNQIQWAQAAMAQYSGCLITRPKEVLYLDTTPSST